MKKLLISAAATAALATSASALTFEYPQLYKDPKVMGMGGANVAVGGSASSLFYNPAGLAYIPKEYGVEVELINLNISINENIMDFASDLSDATDAPGDLDNDGIPDEDDDETLAALDVFEAYMGKNIHFDVNDMLSVSKKGEKIAFAVAAFGGASFDFRTHRGFGTDGVMEVQGIGYGGVALGGSYDFKEVPIGSTIELNSFSLGFGLKQVTYFSVNDAVTINEYIDNKDDFGSYVQDDLAKEGTSVVYDLGGTYHVLPNMIVGVSAMNIGGIGDKDAVYIPMTINAGVGYLKRWEGHKFFNQVRMAFDYIDISKEYDQDTDIIKRSRMGLETNVWDGWFSTLSLRGGLYQGAPTYGLNLRLTMLQIGYAYYQEEVGAYAGQDRDARHIVNLTFGW